MLCIRNLTKRYNLLEVFHNLSFNIENEEIVAMIGPSGCGKSTLLKMIAGLQSVDQGEIISDSGRIAFVFQEDRLLPWETVWNNIRLVMQENDTEKIQNLINQVGLQGFEDYYPSELSGGMRKRCGIARAFAYNSELLLMDEPFSGLDYILRQEMITMLRSIWYQQKQSVLFITHEIDEAMMVADRILILSGRPGMIKKEIILPDKQKDRNLRKLEKLRMEIIETMMEEKNHGCVTKFAS